MKKLSRQEMKTVMGGNEPQPCHCSCVGSVGSWEYTSEPSGRQINTDISTYCSTGQATCAGCRNIGGE